MVDRGIEDGARHYILKRYLWSAPPDATLQDLARKGHLNKPAVLAAQTDRLLDDARSRAFTRAFLYQWLAPFP